MDKKSGAIGKHFASALEHRVRDIGCDTSGTVTSRYYKGLSAEGDNMVLEIWKIVNR